MRGVFKVWNLKGVGVASLEFLTGGCGLDNTVFALEGRASGRERKGMDLGYIHWCETYLRGLVV